MNSVEETQEEQVVPSVAEPEKVETKMEDENCKQDEKTVETGEEEKTEKSRENEEIEKDGGMDQEMNKEQSVPDPYAYIKRNEFTSEIYKIEIYNLPKKFGYAQMKKKLHNLQLKPSKIKAFPEKSFVFVNFRCEEDRDKALKVIEGQHFKGRPMKVKKANPAADPLAKKRKLEAEAGEGPEAKTTKPKADEPALSPVERLNQAVTPLWKETYESQLETKFKDTREYMKRLGYAIWGQNVESRGWLAEQRTKYEGLPCELLPIKSSPVLTGYRNKCEFTIGKALDGKDKTVGFRLGSYRSGSVHVADVQECVHINDQMKLVTKCIQEYLQTSPLPSFDNEHKTGNWRQATVRTTKCSDVMVTMEIHPQSLTQEEVEEEKQKMCEFFTNNEDGKKAGITSLYCTVNSDRVSSPDGNFTYDYIHGEKYIHENLLNLKFRISPDAFFQVNTLAAEVLYSTVKEWCGLTSETVVLDICCGTGTIGLSMAKEAKKIVGIELCKAAVEDARENAKLNNIENVEFCCGRAEHVLPRMIGRFHGQDVVAVVDPPRGGLHGDVVQALRKAQYVKRLVYVSCNPKGAMHNLTSLARTESRKMKGKPFRVMRAVPVDLFPHTSHCELVLLLQRD